MTLSLPPPTQKLVENDRSIATPWYRYMGQITSDLNNVYLPWVNVREYGAVGNGTTDDTSAIAKAFTAATSANKALYFPSGYTFLMDTLNVTGNNWHIIIAQGCTVKLKADGGSASSGLFYIDGSGGRIDNYGTLDGNQANQTYAQYPRTTGLIMSAETTLTKFVYSNGGVGLITNLFFSALAFDVCGAVEIDGCRITNGCPVDDTKTDIFQQIGVGIYVSHPTGDVTVRGVRITNSPIGGIKFYQDTTDCEHKIFIDDIVVDWRGVDLPHTGNEPSIGYLAIECWRYFPHCVINDVSVFSEADSVGDNALVIGVSHGSTVGLRVLGGTNVNGTRAANMTFGIECGGFRDVTHTGFIIDSCAWGVTQSDTARATLQGIIKNCPDAAVWHSGDGLMMMDVTVIDCGANAGVFTPTFRLTGTAGEGVNLKTQTLYDTLDANIVAVHAVSGTPVHVHDSLFNNQMAGGSRVVSLDFAGAHSSVTDSTFIGQGNSGTCITSTADGLRIHGNHFVDYDSPWDTSAGTNSLITDNQVVSCSSGGVTDATDTVADNSSW